MKLLHDRGSHTETVRAKLTEVLDALVAKGIIKSHEQVFRDFFCLLLRATTKRLMESEGLTEHDNSKCTSQTPCFILTVGLVRVAFAVPVCATSQAIGFMSAKLQAAMMLERFGSGGTSACDLVPFSEAEAQAMHACVLAHFGLKVCNIVNRVMTTRADWTKASEAFPLPRHRGWNHRSGYLRDSLRGASAAQAWCHQGQR